MYSTGKLIEDTTILKIRTVQTEDNRLIERERALYNLDAIISVGYRVNSRKATKFRRNHICRSCSYKNPYGADNMEICPLHNTFWKFTNSIIELRKQIKIS